MSNSRVVDRTPLLFTLLGAVGKVLLGAVSKVLLGAVLTFLLGAVGKILLDVVLFLLQLQHRIQAKSFGYRVNGVGAAMKLVEAKRQRIVSNMVRGLLPRKLSQRLPKRLAKRNAKKSRIVVIGK